MAEHDSLAYIAASSKLNFPQTNLFSPGATSSSSYDTTIYPFSIERKDGTISKQSIQLNNSSPHEILGRMAASISFPPPPPPPPIISSQPQYTHQNNEYANIHHRSTVSNQFHQQQFGAVRNNVDQFIWSQGSSLLFGGHHHHKKTPNSTNRNVIHFLNNLDYDHIKQRKLDRINATAAVLVARRAFQFSAIDGTGLGWSSASLAITISRLTDLHEEHRAKLGVTSFYPFRLVLTSDEFQSRVDLFGGVVRLNPAATVVQWLGVLMDVTTEDVRILKENQRLLKRYGKIVEDALGLRVVKGHTCESEEYYRCMERLAMESRRWDDGSTRGGGEEGKNNALLAVSNEACAVIESEQACRRGRLRKDGTFEVGAGMGLQMIRKTLGDYAVRSNESIRIESEKRARCQEVVDRFMYEFGVQRVRKISSLVASDQMSDCLSTLRRKEEGEKEILRCLAGQSIGIAGSGQLCHLGDDGSIIIPTNCS